MESLKAAKSDERWKDACEDGSESSDECGDDGGEDCDKFVWLILICVRGFGRTDERTDGQTLVIVEFLWQLKNIKIWHTHSFIV